MASWFSVLEGFSVLLTLVGMRSITYAGHGYQSCPFLVSLLVLVYSYVKLAEPRDGVKCHIDSFWNTVPRIKSSFKKQINSWAWHQTPVILALER